MKMPWMNRAAFSLLFFMRYFISIIFILFALPVFSAELPISNAGFVQSNIWYSKDPFYTGDKIRIYTVIFNGSAYDLTGAVEFLDNGTSLGKTNFSLSGSGRAQDLWIDWKATAGSHTITARLVNVIADGPNGKQSVSLPSAETGKSERVVDLDPVAKEAQAKLEAQKVADSQAKTIGKVNDALQTVNNTIPAPVKEAASSSMNAIEQFRIGEGYQVRLAKEAKQKEIAVIKADEAKALTAGVKTVRSQTDAMLNTAEKPFAYVMLAILTALQYFLEWQIIFYGVSLYIIYRIIKWVVGRIRNR